VFWGHRVSLLKTSSSPAQPSQGERRQRPLPLHPPIPPSPHTARHPHLTFHPKPFNPIHPNVFILSLVAATTPSFPDYDAFPPIPHCSQHIAFCAVLAIPSLFLNYCSTHTPAQQRWLGMAVSSSIVFFSSATSLLGHLVAAIAISQGASG
jgi:hypothetical protein